MEFKNIKDNSYSVPYQSSTIKCDGELGTIESDACGLFGKFNKENFRAEKIFNIFIKKDFKNVLDIGAGRLEATEQFVKQGKNVDICDFDDGLYYKNTTCDKDKINKLYLGIF